MLPDESIRILDDQEACADEKYYKTTYNYLNAEATTLKGNC